MSSQPVGRAHHPLLARCALTAVLLLACGPTGAAGRTAADSTGGAGGGLDADTMGGASGTGGVPGTGGASGGSIAAGGSQATGGNQATGGSGAGGSGAGGSDGEPDVAIDEPVALPPDLVPPRQALLVVGDPKALTGGDSRLKTAIEARGFAVTLGDDGGITGDAARMDLVVIASSSASAMVTAKFRDITIPILDLESAIYDDMKMTGPTSKTDFDEEDDRRIIIVTAQEGHPLAAGLTGTITVNRGGTDPCCGINWGKPAATALPIATYTSASNGKIAIFAYEKNAKMVDGFIAPARRVGFFAADTSMEHLTEDGLKLLNAALTWVAP
jgi:hypothetical protein